MYMFSLFVTVHRWPKKLSCCGLFVFYWLSYASSRSFCAINPQDIVTIGTISNARLFVRSSSFVYSFNQSIFIVDSQLELSQRPNISPMSNNLGTVARRKLPFNGQKTDALKDDNLKTLRLSVLLFSRSSVFLKCFNCIILCLST